MADLDVRVSDGALWLTLNRPQVLNALTGEMADSLAHLVESATARDDVRVVALTGTGSAFSTGADLSGAESSGAESSGSDLSGTESSGAESSGTESSGADLSGTELHLDQTALDRANRIIRAITTLDKPVVAGVNGVAAGVGCSAALAADLVVAAESATFLLAFARIGLMPDGGATATVAASIGRARAMRMALLAEPLTAREAYDAGLVTDLASDDEFPEVFAAVVRRLAAGPPLAFAATKKAINAATLAGLDGALERERTGQTVLLRTRDAAEGVAAFTARRRPVFRGE